MKIEFRNMLWGLAAICLSPIAQADPAADVIDVSGFYARAAPPDQPNSAAFMTLTNNSENNHALVAVKSPAAKVVELHTHTMDGGMMRMRPVEKIQIPAGGAVELQPGGLHVMLIGLDHQLMPGEDVQITLIYEDGSKATLQAPVRKVQAMTHHH